MKKTAIFALLIIAMLVLTACVKQDKGSRVPAQNEPSQEVVTAPPQPALPQVKGTVFSYYGPPIDFGIVTDTDEYYGFLADDNTEIVWEDAILFETEELGSDQWEKFSCNMEVTVTYGEEADPRDPYPFENAVGWYRAEKVVVNKVLDSYFEAPAKPVIYLYPTEVTDVFVKLDLDGHFTCTYPEYGEGWKVTAHPDSTLTDIRGTEYNYLYWEGLTVGEYDFSKGFCIAGKDTAAFLEDALSRLGLTRREANEFIVYWLPMMQENPYNVISFQANSYTDRARLSINPEPDTLLRVFMAWYPSEAAVEISPQKLSAPDRRGFCAVEWGGACTDRISH